jgi:hypothetical protein
MEQSILTGTKQILGLDESYTAFDFDVITHINSAFATLNQLGIGPDDGFMIEDATAVWDDFYTDNLPLNPVKTYVYLRVRMLFDPPTTSYMIEAMQKQIAELEWRLNIAASSTDLVELPDQYQAGTVLVNQSTGDLWEVL